MRLTPQWADWFDTLACQATLDGEFFEPVHPEQLLDAAPEVIWPGLMPPDLMPLAGNTLGDWLCGRIGSDDTISEVVHWYHGGGDCLPYGRTMSEALLYDALAPRFAGWRLRLAQPAEPLPSASRRRLADRIGTRWALQHLGVPLAEVFSEEVPACRVAEVLLEHGVAEVAVRCDHVLAALDNEIRRRMTPQLAAQLGVGWERDVVRWMFDVGQASEALRRQMASQWGVPEPSWKLQDWMAAADHCRQVAAVRDDLAWVHDILGWAAERCGRLDEAIEHYCQGAQASLFTDQSVRFRTHFDSDQVCKFSIARLRHLGREDRLDAEYLRCLLVGPRHAGPDDATWRDRVCQYWLDKAEHSTAAGIRSAASRQESSPGVAAAARRYELVYRAGWDVGCDTIQRYGQLLAQLAEAAAAAGQAARAELAKTHAECLHGRYFLG